MAELIITLKEDINDGSKRITKHLTDKTSAYVDAISLHAATTNGELADIAKNEKYTTAINKAKEIVRNGAIEHHKNGDFTLHLPDKIERIDYYD